MIPVSWYFIPSNSKDWYQTIKWNDNDHSIDKMSMLQAVVSIGRLTAFYVVLVPLELIPSKPPLCAYVIVSFCTLQKGSTFFVVFVFLFFNVGPPKEDIFPGHFYVLNFS